MRRVCLTPVLQELITPVLEHKHVHIKANAGEAQRSQENTQNACYAFEMEIQTSLFVYLSTFSTRLSDDPRRLIEREEVVSDLAEPQFPLV